MIVADASALVDLLLGPGGEAGGRVATSLVSGEAICVPHLADVEVAQVLRRYALRWELTATDLVAMVADLTALPLTRYPHGPLLARATHWMQNVTIYDGVYLALAEALEAPLVTADHALADVPDCGTDVVVLPSAD